MALRRGSSYNVVMHTALFALLTLSLLAACADPATPEEEVRTAIGRMAQAAEERDVGALMDQVSKHYRDASGRGADELSRYVRGYFIANQSIHLITRIEEVEFPSSEEARTRVLVGMAGRAADAPAPDFNADLQRFDVVWVREDGEWKVSYAACERTASSGC